MSNQMELSWLDKPNKELGEREKKRAVDAVAVAARNWRSESMPVLRQIAGTVEEFTTDRVQWELNRQRVAPPIEPRAYGALMREAARAGLIEKTDRVVASVYPRNHRRPKAIWKSRIFRVKP
jgi:hypothetical protein